MEAPRTWKRDEKGKQSAGCSEAKDVEIFKEDIEGRKEKGALTALKGAKGNSRGEIRDAPTLGILGARAKTTSDPWLGYG